MARYQLLVLGASAGGLEAMLTLLTNLPADFALPIAVVQHQDARSTSHLAQILGAKLALKVIDVEDKQPIEPAVIYLAPPGYHLQVESDQSFSLSVDEPVHYARPSVDVLFESAAKVYGPALIGVLLTGANDDGAAGLACVQEQGGAVLIQDPKTALAPEMPAAGVKMTGVTEVYSLEDMAKQILQLTSGEDDA